MQQACALYWEKYVFPLWQVEKGNLELLIVDWFLPPY